MMVPHCVHRRARERDGRVRRGVGWLRRYKIMRREREEEGEGEVNERVEEGE